MTFVCLLSYNSMVQLPDFGTDRRSECSENRCKNGNHGKKSMTCQSPLGLWHFHTVVFIHVDTILLGWRAYLELVGIGDREWSLMCYSNRGDLRRDSSKP